MGKKTTSKVVVDILREFSARFGLPRELEILFNNGIEHKITPVCNSSTNKQAKDIAKAVKMLSREI